MSAVEQPVGLLTDNQPVALEGVRIDAILRQSGAQVQVRQRYRNTESRPIEAVYVFPLDDRSAVCGFAAMVGERRIEGRVEERDKAFDAYDRAIAAGHGAFLLDQERPNVFTASVGNLLPGEEVVLELTYVSELGREDEALRFMLPTTVSPRYTPAVAGAPATPEHERVNPPHRFDVPYGLELSVDIRLGGPIARVESPSHLLQVDTHGDRATVSLAGGEVALDRDFVLLVEPTAHEPLALVEREDDGALTAAVTFLPEVDLARAPRPEVLFVIDCSGSMNGESIAQARQALRLCLRQLSYGDRFNVVRFGSRWESLYDTPREYTAETFAEADALAEQMAADLGGTDILPPLRALVEEPPAEGFRRQVLLLTDGQVSNESEVIELLRNHRDRTRVFTFGIGAGASHYLVREAARASGGAAEFIFPGERIESKVLRQFSRIASPPLYDVSLSVDGADVQVSPESIPPVFDGDALTLYLHAENEPSGPATATLRAQSLTGPQAWRVPIDFAAAQPGCTLGTLWARARIGELEEATPLHVRRGSAQRGRTLERDRRRIVELGLRYGLMSSETSYVAIEERADDEKSADAPELRQIPVALTKGWGALTQQQPVTVAGAAGMAFAGMATAAPGVHLGLLRAAARSRSAAAASPSDFGPGDDDFMAAISMEEMSPEHMRIMMLQTPDGAFPLSDELANIAGVAFDELRAAAFAVNSGHAEGVIATLLALHLLTDRHRAAEAEWRRAAQKAEAWLTDVAQVDHLVGEGLPVRDWFAGWLAARRV